MAPAPDRPPEDALPAPGDPEPGGAPPDADTAPPAPTPEERFFHGADRVAQRLATQLDALDANYRRLRAEEWSREDFMNLSEPIARRVLELDRRLPVPPTQCLGEEAALLCALQAAANAALQVTPGAAGAEAPDRAPTLHHASFQRSVTKSRQHLADYAAARERARARAGGPDPDADAPTP